MADTIRTLSEHAGEWLTDLSTVFERTNQAEQLLNALGWASPPGLDDLGLSALTFSDVIDKLRTLLDSTEAEQNDELLMAQRLAELTIAVANAVRDVRQFAADLPANLSGFDDFLTRSALSTSFRNACLITR